MMRLVVATMQDYDAPGLLRDLARRGWGATQIASTGKALRAGTTTLLIGVPQGQVPQVLRLIDEHCRRSVEPVTPDLSSDEGTFYPSGLVATESGGAAVSVLKVVHFERL